MISMPPPAFPAISADASHRLFSSPRNWSKLAVLCAVLFALLCGAGKTGSAQTVAGNFGTTNIGSTSPTVSLVFTFGTADTLSSVAVLTQGATGLDFSDAGSDTCTANTAYLAGQSCTVNVTFTPRFAGTRSGGVVLEDNSGNTIASGHLQGTGVGPQIAFLPGTQIAYGAAGPGGPVGVAVEGNGNIYYSPAGSGVVFEMAAVNGIVPTPPTLKIVASGFGESDWMTMDGSGNLYIADTQNNAVKEILAVNGIIPASPTIRTLGGGFSVPVGIAVDGNGNVYVTGLIDGTVKEILAVNGSIPASPTIRVLSSSFSEPRGIAVDGVGDLFVSNSSSSQVKEIIAVNGSIPSSPTINVLGSGFSSPAGVTLDGSGNVYVADSGNNAVKEILAASGYMTVNTLGSNFSDPSTVVVDGSGNVYVGDYGNDRVVKLDLADPPSLTFASTAVGATSSDSPRTVTIENIGNAELTFPVPSTGNNPSISTNFSLNSSGSSACPLLSNESSEPATLAVGASCQLPISFVPTTTGALTGSLVLTDNNLNAAAPGYTAQSIALSGTGIQTLPSFTLGSAPASLTIVQGTAGTSSITVTGVSGFSGSVNLAASGLPSGVTASFSPNPTTGTSVLTVTASSAAATGTYNATITGTSGSLTATTVLVLTVNPSPSFALGASPASLAEAQGGSVTSTIAVTALNGFAGSVNLAASGLPGGVTASFSPNPATGTSVLTLTANGSAILGTATVTISGTSGMLTTTTSVVLTTTAPQGFVPSSENFGAVNTGTTSPVQTLTYTFGSAVTLGSTSVLTQGATGLDFTDAGSDTCAANTAYAAGQSCTVNVSFAPRFAGNRFGAVVLNDSNGNVIAAAYLQGTGVGPQLNFFPGTQATLGSSFNFASGISVDGNGNAYVVDTINNLGNVQEITAVNGSIPANPSIRTLVGGLDCPIGPALDGAGNVYFADICYHTVNEIQAVNGSIPASPTVRTLTSQFVLPAGIAVDGSGNVYVLDASNNTVNEILAVNGSIPASPTIMTLASGFKEVDGIAVDSNGNVYVSDDTSREVFEIHAINGSIPTSPLITSLGSGFVIPRGIVVDGTGNVYVAEYFYNTVYEILAVNGSIPASPTIQTLGTGLLYASGVAVDGNRNVFVADYGDSRVVRLDYADPPSLTFASTAVGLTSTDSPQTVTVENVGNAPLSFPIPSTGNNPSIAANFVLNSSGGSACPLVNGGSSAAGTLAAGASCQLPINFAPTAASALSGSLVLTDSNLNTAAPGFATQAITLSGTGTQASPTITWATPAAITYGTPLNPIQLSATSTAAGAFTYSPVAGTVLGAGVQTLTATFTPTDTTDYTTTTATVTLTVNQATPTITWATPAAITYGTALSATQQNAGSTVAGSFSYLPTAGTVLTAGQQRLTATFTPTDIADYPTATATVTLTVNKATPTITWATPAAITYGTALSATQLDAKASVLGALVYSPVAGTAPAVGTDTLTVTFTPTDTTDYTTVTDSVLLKVNPAPSFTLGASPTSLRVVQGALGKSTIAVTGQNGFTGSVTLAASGLPSGVTASFSTNPTTGTSVLTLTASSTATVGSAAITIKGTSGSLTTTTTVALTVTAKSGFACHVVYSITSQWSSGFETAVTVENTGTVAVSNWTLTFAFANGQKVTQAWNGNETQSGANVTVTNMSYNGSIPAGGSYNGMGFNGSWNNITNAVPASFAVNGTVCK